MAIPKRPGLQALRPVLIATLLTGVPVIILLILQWRFIGQLRTASTDVVQQTVDDSAEVLAQRGPRAEAAPLISR